ncbi:NADPH:quinone reductase [Amycolatopsis saalfeldensis]|uniref:NADPH:quinone reductase n=2 Tax=Amycolatopsis saalfeldensis TaxID=394193 RepID=A0A1H8T305_9PSEU|nr:NAD(P)-dependent alcohol dehydrogenase [Amycolatopsis saalfeldensis]SEO84984.1 NADPH:quinone reductase [Amycolatopsis saalfeldensis]
MRAARFDRYGPAEVLYEARVPKPVPEPGQVLVRVHATSVNGGDLHIRAGRVKVLTGRKFPMATGVDFTGEIASAAPGLEVGDRVWGLRRAGGVAAEYIAVDPDRLSLAPKGLDLVEAAALPVGTTAITALRDKARLKAGERLLVRGAAGGVGAIAVQLGHAMGAHVTALTGAGTVDLVRELGADEAHDYRRADPAALGSFDVVLSTTGTGLPTYRRLLSPRGRMVTIAFDTDHPLPSLSDIAGAHRALEAGGVRVLPA